MVNSKDGFDFAILFPLRESWRTSDSALLRVRSKELRLYPQTLSLKPSDFCYVGVKLLMLIIPMGVANGVLRS